MTNRLSRILAASIMLAIALSGAPVLGQANAPEGNSAKWGQAAVNQAESLSAAFRQAAHAVLPTVVRIDSTIKARQVNRRSPQIDTNPFRGTPFEDFFSDEFGFPFEQGIIPERHGTGSGVIISADGLVLTNNHVVEGADEIVVKLSDGRELKASDVRTDPLTDIAILRIEANEPLPFARLGDSDNLQIGDWVLAIGHPFELGSSVSAGIISAKGRSLAAANRASFLQTDAAVNPGNSGGPLINLRGEVVGINTAIATRSGGYQGISFAVPINLAKWVIDQLVKDGEVQRAFLGVGIEELTPELRELLGIDRDLKGVFVKMVQSGTPADEAGLEAGDVIVRFAGQPVDSPNTLQRIVERLPIGSTQQVELVRNGRRVTVSVVLQDYNGAMASASNGDNSALPQSEDLGLEVDELTPDIARRLGYTGKQGVLITGVARNGLAWRAGLRSGMLITRVGDTRIRSRADLRAALEDAPLDRGVFVEVLTPSTEEQSQSRQLFLLKRR